MKKLRELLCFNQGANNIVTRTTVGNSIANFVSEFRKFRPGFNVVSGTILSFKFFSTILASIIISYKNFSPPYPVSMIVPTLCVPTFIVPRLFPKHGVIFSSTFLTKFLGVKNISTFTRSKHFVSFTRVSIKNFTTTTLTGFVLSFSQMWEYVSLAFIPGFHYTNFNMLNAPIQVRKGGGVYVTEG